MKLFFETGGIWYNLDYRLKIKTATLFSCMFFLAKSMTQTKHRDTYFMGFDKFPYIS